MQTTIASPFRVPVSPKWLKTVFSKTTGLETFRLRSTMRNRKDPAMASSLFWDEMDFSWGVEEMKEDVIQNRDSTCQARISGRVEASADRVFDLFERIDLNVIFDLFKTIRSYEVIEEIEGKRKVDLDIDAKWSFWKVSGECLISMSMTLDRPGLEIPFFQKVPGFLEKYDGKWNIFRLDSNDRPFKSMHNPERTNSFRSNHEAQDGLWNSNRRMEEGSKASLVTLDLNLKPSVVPPPPLNRLLKGNTLQQMHSLFQDLKAELNKDERPTETLLLNATENNAE